MKTDSSQFDFTKVGKRTPFRTPEGFFEAAQKKLLQSSGQDLRQHSFVHRTSLHRTWYYAIAALLLLVIGIFALIRFIPQQAPAHEAHATDVPFYSQTYDNSVDWSDFADADIFLDNIE